MPQAEWVNRLSFLVVNGSTGQYLVGDDPSSPECYKLCVKLYNGSIASFVIEPTTDNGFRIQGAVTNNGEKSFSSIEELVSYYEQDKREVIGIQLNAIASAEGLDEDEEFEDDLESASSVLQQEDSWVNPSHVSAVNNGVTVNPVLDRNQQMQNKSTEDINNRHSAAENSDHRWTDHVSENLDARLNHIAREKIRAATAVKELRKKLARIEEDKEESINRLLAGEAKLKHVAHKYVQKQQTAVHVSQESHKLQQHKQTIMAKMAELESKMDNIHYRQETLRMKIRVDTDRLSHVHAQKRRIVSIVQSEMSQLSRLRDQRARLVDVVKAEMGLLRTLKQQKVQEGMQADTEAETNLRARLHAVENKIEDMKRHETRMLASLASDDYLDGNGSDNGSPKDRSRIRQQNGISPDVQKLVKVQDAQRMEFERKLEILKQEAKVAEARLKHKEANAVLQARNPRKSQQSAPESSSSRSSSRNNSGSEIKEPTNQSGFRGVTDELDEEKEQDAEEEEEEEEVFGFDEEEEDGMFLERRRMSVADRHLATLAEEMERGMETAEQRIESMVLEAMDMVDTKVNTLEAIYEEDEAADEEQNNAHDDDDYE